MSHRAALTLAVVLSSIKILLGSVLVYKGVAAISDGIAPAISANCVEDFQLHFAREDVQLAISAVLLGVGLLAATQRKAIGEGGAESEGRGCAKHMIQFARFCLKRGILTAVLFLTWIALEATYLLVIEWKAFEGTMILNVIFHAVFSPMLLLSENFHVLVFSPFRTISRAQSATQRFLVAALALDISVLYIKVCLVRRYACSSRETSVIVALFSQVLILVAGLATLTQAGKYFNAMIDQRRPCAELGSKSKFVILENLPRTTILPVAPLSPLIPPTPLPPLNRLCSTTGAAIFVTDFPAEDVFGSPTARRARAQK